MGMNCRRQTDRQTDRQRKEREREREKWREGRERVEWSGVKIESDVERIQYEESSNW